MTKRLTERTKKLRANLRANEKAVKKALADEKLVAGDPKTKKAASKPGGGDLRDVETVVGYLLDNSPDGSPPVTTVELVNDSDLTVVAVRRACHNAVKLGRLVRDGGGYRLAKGQSKPILATLSAFQEVEVELLKCNEMLAAWPAKAEARAVALRKQVTGWELRNNVQVATYRLEQHEAGLMRDGVDGLAGRMDAWLKKMDEFFTAKPGNERTVDEWTEWASEQARKLVQIKAVVRECQRTLAPVMTEIRPERKTTEAMLMSLMGLPDPDAEDWPRNGDTGPGEEEKGEAS